MELGTTTFEHFGGDGAYAGRLVVFEVVDCFGDLIKGRRRIVRDRRWRWRGKIKLLCINFGVRIEEFGEMFTPTIEFLLGRCERFAVSVVEVVGWTGAGAKKLAQVAVGGTEMILLDISVKFEGGITPGFLIALTSFDFAPVFDFLVGFLEVRFLRTF